MLVLGHTVPFMVEGMATGGGGDGRGPGEGSVATAAGPPPVGSMDAIRNWPQRAGARSCVRRTFSLDFPLAMQQGVPPVSMATPTGGQRAGPQVPWITGSVCELGRPVAAIPARPERKRGLAGPNCRRTGTQE